MSTTYTSIPLHAIFTFHPFSFGALWSASAAYNCPFAPSPLTPSVTIPPRCSTELDSCPILLLLLLLPRRKKAYMAPTYAHRRPTPSSSYIPPSFLVSLALSSSPSLDRCRGRPKWRAAKGIFPAPRYSCFAQSSKSQSLSQCKVNFWVSAFSSAPFHLTHHGPVVVHIFPLRTCPVY